MTSTMDAEFSDASSNRSRSPTSDLSSDNGQPMELKRKRGRGRGSGRGRGRGQARGSKRGRGRGQGNRGQLQEVNKENRIAQLENRVDSMSVDDMRILLKRISKAQPSFVLNILDNSNVGNGQPAGPEPPKPDQPSWCSCSNCREMPTQQERLCCKRQPMNCHSRLPDFQQCVLDELVLELAIRYRNDFLAQPEDENYNRCHRHAAYRQYILWIHGYLGAGNRRVIPSCCVWRIRDKYPDATGQYVGFVGGRLG
ncbi:Hypothetical predicted protein [Mytilus galloprovincialis]|uniref:P2X purinoreceptor 7 intracellular domain-containing protein n=1 Tax=Mytilus galloprovincialis TaxID=29158 RepID=A0A8B6GUH1_MYTGA|nr:Hypothetical predicted protein [Mytilus galloprovincialis]